MDEREFWRIVGLLNWKRTGDDDAVLKPAVKELAKHSLEDIAAFEELLSQKLYSLDTMAHAKQIGADAYTGGQRHFSVDLFLYARCCVVANGEDFYASVLSNPAQFPKDMDFEALLELASAAYELKSGEAPDVFDTSVSYETFSNQAGWAAA